MTRTWLWRFNGPVAGTSGGTAALTARWRALWAEPTRGWDLSEFAGRVFEESPPWDYEQLVRYEFRSAGSGLDLGTGGGEFLSSIRDWLPVEMHATEGWPPNLSVARERLEPLGIQVAEYDGDSGDPLPYPDESVDVVISRHESYAATEVVRVLRPGGWFVTQQVDGHNLDDLAAHFGAGPAYPSITLARLRVEAEAAGLIIERAQEWHGPIRFDSVDTLVSYLRWMPWHLPADFTVDGYAEQLLDLHRQEEPLEFTERRFLLVCHRPIPRPPRADPFPQWEKVPTTSRLS